MRSPATPSRRPRNRELSPSPLPTPPNSIQSLSSDFMPASHLNTTNTARRHPIDFFNDWTDEIAHANAMAELTDGRRLQDGGMQRIRQLLRGGTVQSMPRLEASTNTRRDTSLTAVNSARRDTSPATNARRDSSMHPSFRNKHVLELSCSCCDSVLTDRAMSAILLADTSVQLFSTDLTPPGCAEVGDDYRTGHCACRIRDLCCLHGCGNTVGYHVVLPCNSCLNSSHNSHMFMFHSDCVGTERLDEQGGFLKWGVLISRPVEKPTLSYSPCR